MKGETVSVSNFTGFTPIRETNWTFWEDDSPWIFVINTCVTFSQDSRPVSHPKPLTKSLQFPKWFQPVERLFSRLWNFVFHFSSNGASKRFCWKSKMMIHLEFFVRWHSQFFIEIWSLMIAVPSIKVVTRSDTLGLEIVSKSCYRTR